MSLARREGISPRTVRRPLEILISGEQSVQQLQQALGLGQPVVSQQLSVLRTSNIVSARKQGVSVRYGLRDPLLADLLTVARQIFDNHLVGTGDMLRQLRAKPGRRPRQPRPRGGS
jgi:DNA-binding transcriptional ArsR family regulator